MHRPYNRVAYALIPALFALPTVQASGSFGVGSGGGYTANARLYDGATLATSVDVTPYCAYSGGARVAAGDVNADGQADLVVIPDVGLATLVRLYDGGSVASLGSYYAFDTAYTGGAYVAAGDVDGDGYADVIVGAASASQVKVFSGKTAQRLLDYYAYSPSLPLLKSADASV